MQTMKKLEEIAWSGLSIASGCADNIPQALHGLVSPDENVRKRSYWQLDNRVVLQADLYEAAYFVVPFLIQLLDEKVAHGRDLIYDLVFEIANGYAPESVRCRTIEGDELSLKAACEREVRKGLPVFRRDLSDDDPRVKATSHDLLDLLASIQQDNGKVPGPQHSFSKAINET